jgi:hypothetical protein
MLIKINSQNTTNGAPRRGWILTGPNGAFIKFYEEGYDDGGEELRALIKAGEIEMYPAINVTPKEYKRILGLVK